MNFIEECKTFSIEHTTRFLKEYPELAAKGAETEEKQINNISNFYAKKIQPNEQTTKPDYLVSIILELVFNNKESDRELIQKQYNNQKQTEMMIGQLLEWYLLKEGKNCGWVFTAECVRAVDFLKKESNSWIRYQIKNSDNTENSSAKDIRTGTPIIHWFRRFSNPKVIIPKKTKKGTISKNGWGKFTKELEIRQKTLDLTPFHTPLFNWENFPDEKLKERVSEAGFKEFVINYFQTGSFV
tara:strand:+ start:2572 stop:3294 length:723 start_codon:yes stop_codon:yes gene_type:complete